MKQKINYKKQLSDFYISIHQGHPLDEAKIISIKDTLKKDSVLDYYCYYMNMLFDQCFKGSRFEEAELFLKELEAVGQQNGGFSLAFYYLMKGSYHWYHSNDLGLLLEYSQRALTLNKELGVNSEFIKFLGEQFIGVAYIQTGDYMGAYRHIYVALHCRLPEMFKFRKALTYKWLGIIEEHYLNFKQTLKYYLKCIEILKKYSLEKACAEILCNIGCLHFDNENFELALEAWTQSLNLAQKHNQANTKADVLANLGLYAYVMNDFEKAIEQYNKCLELEHRPEKIANLHSNIGLCYSNNKQFDLAEKRFHQCLTMYAEQENTYLISTTNCHLAELYIKKGEYERALACLKQAETETDEILQRRIYTIYATLYAGTKQYKEGFELFEKYIALTDSIAHQERKKQLDFDVFKNEVESDIEKKS